MKAQIGFTSRVALLLLASIKIKASAFSPKLTTFLPHHISNTRPRNRGAQNLSLKLSSTSTNPNDDTDTNNKNEPDEGLYDIDNSDPELRLRAMTFEQLDKSTEPQLLSDFLMELGACSVSITDHDVNTDRESPIFREPSQIDDVAAVICGDAAVGKNVWMRCDVTSHFPSTFDLVHVADQVRYTFGMATMPRYRVDDVPDKDWVVHVQSSWKPAVVGGFVLRFPWHEDGDVLEAVQKSAALSAAADDSTDGLENGLSSDVGDYTQLQLEGGIAFGTGEHATTQLCLGWIRNILVKYGEETSLFLDYGAGSGVLGMAACAMSNNRIQSVGVEIDPDAIRIADYNANVNGLEMKSYLPRSLGDDDESASVIMKALHRTTTDVLPESLDGPRYDACAANILAGPLRSLVKTIADMVRSGGRIGLSGILSYQAEDVVQTYSEFFDDVKVEREQAGWVLITGTRK